MDVMILAAGLGTRLRPLTNRVPKALVPVGGVPVLDRVAERVVAAGADRIVVNVSAHAAQVRGHIERRAGWGVDVRVSEEQPEPLETGGGLLAAARLFRGDRPILIHNADILTDLDPGELYRAHDPAVLATLAVRPARSDRHLLFDGPELIGWVAGGSCRRVREGGAGEERLDFLGMQVVSPRLLGLMEERGKFSIFTTYMRLLGEGERVVAYRADDVRWLDMGTPADLARAEAEWA